MRVVQKHHRCVPRATSSPWESHSIRKEVRIIAIDSTCSALTRYNTQVTEEEAEDLTLGVPVGKEKLFGVDVKDMKV